MRVLIAASVLAAGIVAACSTCITMDRANCRGSLTERGLLRGLGIIVIEACVGLVGALVLEMIAIRHFGM